MIVSVGHTPFNCHDHVKYKENQLSEVLIHSQFGSLERPYKESIGLGSYIDQKSVVLSKNEGEYTYQFCGRSV